VKNYGQLLRRFETLAVSSNAGEAAVWRLGPDPMQGRETRGMRANNNKNRHPRGAREHMGLRIHVPAGTSLSVDRFPPSPFAHHAFGSACA
jgi:hypothetical protein